MRTLKLRWLGLPASFLNQGQICLCGSRSIARSVFETYRDGLVKRAEAMKIGDPLEGTTQLGALVSHAHRDKMASYCELVKLVKF